MLNLMKSSKIYATIGLMRIGILGGGQLGRMLALAGYPLGFRFLLLDPDAAACGGDVAPLLTADYDDPVALERLASECAVVTYDFENVPAGSAETLARRVAVHPAPAALACAQDRWHEKQLFTKLGIATPDYAPVDSRDDLAAALARIGLPAVLKTRRFGYDGKGQVVLRTTAQIDTEWRRFAGQPLLLEAFVPFDVECSIIAVRDAGGQIATYPLTRNLHRDGILAASLAPYPCGATLYGEAVNWISRLLDYFSYIGVMALELFVAGDRLLANEFAPRVHNSGHWTIDGAATSQFENHLRAIAGLPLGATDCRGAALMLNWIGEMPERDPWLALPGLHWHDYRKTPRPGRKLGHATLIAEDNDALRKNGAELAAQYDPAMLEKLLKN